LKTSQWLQDRRLEDVHALIVLQPLLVGHPVLPLTGSALRPHCLTHLINDILIHRRRRILEFGTGLSTILLARLFRSNGLDAHIVSIDHDEHWVATAGQLLQSEGLGDYVDIVCAPLGESDLALEGNAWYDTQILESAVPAGGYDMVLIDGPPAWQPGSGKARFPALPFAIGRLNRRASIYLDDANRPGERSVLGAWTHRFNIPFQITGETLGYAYLGESFYTEPLTKLSA